MLRVVVSYCVVLAAVGAVSAATIHVPADEAKSQVVRQMEGVSRVDYAVGPMPTCIVAVDVDGDGAVDLAVGCADSNEVTILRNDGHGAFPTSAKFSAGDFPVSMSASDFDADGRIDLAVACALSGVLILRNLGNGEFDAPATCSPYGANDVCAGDLDGDGLTDLIAVSYDRISIMRSRGNGTFDTSSFGFGLVNRRAAISDFNGDGTNDLAICGEYPVSVDILFNDGTGVFSGRVTYPSVSSGFSSICASDLRRRGLSDVIAAPGPKGSLLVLLNDGAGNFATPLEISLERTPTDVRCADLDKNGFEDAVMANLDNNTVTILRNAGERVFVQQVSYEVGSGPVAVCAADLDGDGEIELVSTNFYADSVSVLEKSCWLCEPATIRLDDFASSDHLISHSPQISWHIAESTLCSGGQISCQIAIGSDNDWTYAEMWNPAPFNSPDTFVTYAGAALVDGQTYYLRLRISDGTSWSNWYYTSFHMNTPPSAPYPYAPTWPLQTNTTPDLSVVNSTDAENDSIWYDFAVYKDSMLTQLAASATHVPEMHNPDSTTWTVAPPLDDNRYYYWRARAFDGYEYSEWSWYRVFIVNTANEPPSAPWILDPPDSSGPILYNRKPMLRWWMSTDPDPYDQVHYRVQLATDSLFVYRWQQDSAWGNWTSPPDSLPFGGHYWWRLWAIDRAGAEVICPQAKDFWIWTLGDVDHSNNTDIADLTVLIDFLYINLTPIVPRKVADLDGDCAVDIADLSRLIDALYISLVPLTVGGCGP